MPSPRNLSDLVGLPHRDRGCDWAGVNCWGLVVLAYSHCAGITLPNYLEDYGAIDASTRADIGALIARESMAWIPVALGDERPLDAISLTVGRDESHVALVVEPGLMLHVQRGRCSRVERYHSPSWIRRIHGIYRHSELV